MMFLENIEKSQDTALSQKIGFYANNCQKYEIKHVLCHCLCVHRSG
jgi:hypothetical protein